MRDTLTFTLMTECRGLFAVCHKPVFAKATVSHWQNPLPLCALTVILTVAHMVINDKAPRTMTVGFNGELVTHQK